MTDERYNSLSHDNPAPKLTQAEWLEGWHFCADWDGMLVGPGCDGELAHCGCWEAPDPRHMLAVNARAKMDAEFGAREMPDLGTDLDNPSHP